MSLPVQMASVSRTHGIVILTMTAVITLMKPIVVSVFIIIIIIYLFIYLCVLVVIYSQQQLFNFFMHKWFMGIKSCTIEFQFFELPREMKILV